MGLHQSFARKSGTLLNNDGLLTSSCHLDDGNWVSRNQINKQSDRGCNIVEGDRVSSDTDTSKAVTLYSYHTLDMECMCIETLHVTFCRLDDATVQYSVGQAFVDTPHKLNHQCRDLNLSHVEKFIDYW